MRLRIVEEKPANMQYSEPINGNKEFDIQEITHMNVVFSDFNKGFSEFVKLLINNDIEIITTERCSDQKSMNFSINTKNSADKAMLETKIPGLTGVETFSFRK